MPGAETIADVVARMVPALREAWDATAPGETTVVVAHGACLRVSLLAFLGWPESLLDGLRGLDNCGWAVVEADAPDAASGWRRTTRRRTRRCTGPISHPTPRLANIRRVARGKPWAAAGLWRSW